MSEPVDLGKQKGISSARTAMPLMTRIVVTFATASIAIDIYRLFRGESGHPVAYALIAGGWLCAGWVIGTVRPLKMR